MYPTLFIATSYDNTGMLNKTLQSAPISKHFLNIGTVAGKTVDINVTKFKSGMHSVGTSPTIYQGNDTKQTFCIIPVEIDSYMDCIPTVTNLI